MDTKNHSTGGLPQVSRILVATDFSELREQAQQRMDGLKRLVPDAETFVREASPRPTIVDAGVELDCQMIIMGTHGRSGFAHLLLGSVAEYIVRNSKVPVPTVRPQAERS